MSDVTVSRASVVDPTADHAAVHGAPMAGPPAESADPKRAAAAIVQHGDFREERRAVDISPWEEEFGWRMEEKFWEFFNRSEDPEGFNRRWVIERDVPWEQVSREPLSEDAALMIESFYAVESYLPDFAEKGLNHYRRMVGLSSSQINWSYEELKHGRTLQLVLERAGARTRKQMRDFRMDLARKEWTSPYPTPRQMLVYASFQEKETNRNYEHLRSVLEQHGSLGAAQALRIIGRDEAVHHAYYRDVVRMFLEYDEVGTAQDIARVAQSFRMPAQHLMPNMESRVRVMVRNKVFGKKQVRDEAIIPTIKAFGFRDAEELMSVATAREDRAAGEIATIPAWADDGEPSIPLIEIPRVGNPRARYSESLVHAWADGQSTPNGHDGAKGSAQTREHAAPNGSGEVVG